MSIQNNFLAAGFLSWFSLSAFAQYAWEDGVEPSKMDLTRDVHSPVDMQGSFSNGKTPLWLNANKYGLSSLEKENGYMRASVIRPLAADSSRKWALGYGVDLVAPIHYTSHFVVQQAFVEARWLHGVLSVGAKEYPMELKNQTLSSGSQTLGINARPVPQVRLALPEYWSLPILHGWIQLKGHLAFGRMTDDNWQHDFTQRQSRYTDAVLYHSKAIYFRIGNENLFCPWSYEFGLEMAAEFGGRPYKKNRDGQMEVVPTEKGLKGFWQALIPSGADYSDGIYRNVAGNHLGSWVMRLNYDADRFKLGLYADHYFEDDSQMFFLDYDGYGEGADWNKKLHSRFFRYALKDIMLGTELNLKYGRWVRNIVLEYLYTKYQSGPLNHDHSINIPDHVCGLDDYYNHSDYPGWQHWGQVIGNPLYRSPIYNTDGKIDIENNRFIAYHLGVDGAPSDCFGYRVLLTYQKGWGSYHEPFVKMQRNFSFLVEGNCRFRRGWHLKLGYGMDFGGKLMYGRNAGFQLTIGKHGILKM